MIEERTQLAIFGLTLLRRLVGRGCCAWIAWIVRKTRLMNLLQTENHVILDSKTNAKQTLVSTS